MNFQLPEDVEARLNIERFCNKVTKSFYTHRIDPFALVSDKQRSIMSDFIARELEEIEEKLKPDASDASRNSPPAERSPASP